MTKKALVSTAELKRLAQVANSECVTIEVERDGTIVRLMPFAPSELISRHTEANLKPEASLEEWRAANPPKGKGGYPIPASADHPLRQWYDQLGFDPRTMGEADMKRLMAEHEARWKASIPGTKVGKREQSALVKLVGIGVGVRVWSHDVKGCGADTTDRLEARGFIGREQMLSPEEVAQGYTREQVWLLQPGFDAAKRLTEQTP